jgi:hypothetical protein
MLDLPRAVAVHIEHAGTSGEPLVRIIKVDGREVHRCTADDAPHQSP